MNRKLINETIQDGDFVTLDMGFNEEVEFEIIAIINLEERIFPILKPHSTNLGLEDDEAIVFEIIKHENDQDSFDVVLDDELINKVTEEYIKLYS